MHDDQYASRILAFYRKSGRMPSYREIMQVTGMRSTGSVAKLVERLQEAGKLVKDRTGRLLPGRLSEPRILGTVAAGFPTPAEDELADTMSLDEYLIGNPEATFLLKVSGDSMIDAGINPGDLLVVDRSATPREGQIVVAEVDREWTVKYLRKNAQGYWLEAANRKYPPFTATEEMKIAAVVKGVVRKY